MTAYKYLLPLLLGIHSTTAAQAIPAKSIEDSVIGWMKVCKFTGARAPLTADYDKAMPATLLLNAMSFFVVGGASEEKDTFYVSRIRISRE